MFGFTTLSLMHVGFVYNTLPLMDVGCAYIYIYESMNRCKCLRTRMKINVSWISHTLADIFWYWYI